MAPSPSVRPPDPPDSPRTRKKSFADVVSARPTSEPSIALKRPQTYRGKPAIAIQKSEIERLATKYQYALIGKFSHGRPTMDVVRQNFASLGLKGDYSLGSIDSKHLVVNMRLEEDYLRLRLKPTWFIGSYPMRLFKWTTKFHPNRESPLAPVWITLPGLPLHLFEKSILYSIANLVGKPLKIDEPTTNGSRPSLARICVELNVSKPIIDTVWVAESSDNSPEEISSYGFLQAVEYEAMPEYCTSCYHMGHGSSSCLQNEKQQSMVEKRSMGDQGKQTDTSEKQTNMQSAKLTDKGKGKMVSEEAPKVVKRKATNEFMQDARKSRNAEVWREDIILSTTNPDLLVVDQMVQEVVDSRIDVLDDELAAIVQVPNQSEDAVAIPVQQIFVELPGPVITTASNFKEQERSTGREEELMAIGNDLHDLDHEFNTETALVDFEGSEFGGNVGELEEQDSLENDSENDISVPGNSDDFSKDDLMLLYVNKDGNIGDGIEPSFHPHTHSRRRSVGDVAEGLEGLLGNETQQEANLRRSTCIKKKTFKVRKSHVRR